MLKNLVKKLRNWNLAIKISPYLMIVLFISGCSDSVDEISSSVAITSHPVAQTINDGESAAFSVIVSGGGSVSFQWRKNLGAIDGATNNSYNTPPLSLVDSGSSYDVVVSDGETQIISNAATLIVQAVAPTILDQPQSQVALNNSSITFTVTSSGSQPMQYLWFKNGQEIFGATGDSYTIANVSTSDHASSFSVAVTNIAGTTQSNAAILSITDFLVNINVSGLAIGAELQVVNATGNPILHIEDGSRTFSIPALDGSLYDIQISQQPLTPVHNCIVENGTANGQIAATNVSVSVNCAGEVSAFYPNNGLNWNDYVTDDGSSSISATGSACTGDGTGNYFTCLHAGEIRAVSVPGLESCAGLSASDDLGAFNWACDASNQNEIKFISTSLRHNISLTNLVDFDFMQWKSNKLTVYKDQAMYIETPSSQWWGNPISEMPADGVLSTPGSIYLITSDPNVHMTFNADNVALLVKPNVTASITAVNSESILISATDRKYIWIEGAYDATNMFDGVNFLRVTRSTIRNMRIFNKDYVGINDNFRLVNMVNSHANYLTDIFATNSTLAISLFNSDLNYFTQIVSANNASWGVQLNSSRNNIFTQLTVANNQSSGVDLTGQSYNNVFINVTGINNFSGFYISEPGSGNNVIHNLAAFNNSFSGLNLMSSDNSVINLVSTNNGNVNPLNGNEGWGVILGNVLNTSSYFSGLLKFGNNLVGDCKTNANSGIVDTSCEPNALSDFATPIIGINMQNTFVAKINTNDPENTSETTGEQLSNQIFDWLSFSNKYRFWGKSGSATIIPSPDQQRQCKVLEFCHIWDVSLRNTDVVLKGVLSIPTGDDTAVHTWKDTSVIRYLRNAVEIAGDGDGNDNGLCKSDESCLFTPSIGSYQGFGNLVPVNFVSGQLVNIKLFVYEFSGV